MAIAYPSPVDADDGIELYRRLEESELRTEIANVSTEMHSTLRTNAYLNIGAMAALVGLVSAVAAIVS